ncbi:MAG TPA: tetratricopeptide repeat protein [Pirellulales bacterium]|jgi:TolA-binding protein|nr:tetratricopeptide repeat protein [Pirellulales bacterium]
MDVNRRIAVLLVLMLASALGPRVARADPADKQYAKATGYYTQGQAALALDEFQKFLADFGDHPKAPLARFYAGESLVLLRKFAEAAEQFRPLVDLRNDLRLARKALFRAGECTYFAGQWADASTLLEQFLKRYADDKLNAYVLTYLGDVAWEQGHYADSEKNYRRALTDFPEGPLADDCRCGIGRVVERQGKLDEARTLYAAVIKKGAGPSLDTARLHLAGLESTAGNFEVAANTYAELAQAAADEPTKNRARLGQAQALFKLKQLTPARSLLENLTGASGMHVEASYWLGLVQAEQHDYPVAAATLARIAAPADHPLAAAIAFHTGDAWLRAGKTTDALRLFDQVVSSWPKSEFADDALLGRARAALADDNVAGIKQAVDELHRFFPTSDLNPAAARLLARGDLTDKRYIDAVALLEPLVAAEAKQKPDAENLSDRYLLALAYQGHKRHAEVLTTLAPLLASENTQLRTDAIRLQAAALVALEKFAEAIGPLESFLKLAPESDAAPQAQAQLAVCYAETDKWDKARAAYDALSKSSAASEITMPTAEILAESALAAGQQEWSADLFKFLAGENSPTAQAAKGLAGLAWSEMRGGHLAEAADHFQQLLDRCPNDPLAAGAGLARGQIFEREKRYDEALAAYQKVLDRYGKSDSAPQALLGAVRVEELAKHLESAAKLYDRLLKDYPQVTHRDQALYNSAWVLEELGRRDEADMRFEQLHQGNWRSRYWADAVYRLAERALERSNRDKARALLAELIESQPGDEVLGHALYLQGQVAAAGEQWDQVEPPLARLIEDLPESPLTNLARFWLAEATYRGGKYGEAKELFADLAKELTGKHEKWMAMVPLRRAQICVHEHRWADARQIAETIASDFPGFEQQYEVDYVLGRVLANDAHFEDAREAYTRVVRSQLGGQTETAAMAQWMIGETYFHQKNYEAAVREYLRLEVLYNYPTWQAGALLQAGKCHELLGEWEQATEIYARLLKNFPSTSFTDEAARRLRTAREHVAVKGK